MTGVEWPARSTPINCTVFAPAVLVSAAAEIVDDTGPETASVTVAVTSAPA